MMACRLWRTGWRRRRGERRDQHSARTRRGPSALRVGRARECSQSPANAPIQTLPTRRHSEFASKCFLLRLLILLYLTISYLFLIREFLFLLAYITSI